MSLNKEQYLKDFEESAYWGKTYNDFTQAPYSSQIRSSVDEKFEGVNVPGLNDHSLDALLLGKLSDSSKPVFEKTKDNLDTILNDLTANYSIDDAVNLITALPYSKVEGHELSDVHEKYAVGKTYVKKYQEAVQTGNEGLKNAVVSSMLNDILEVVDSGDGIKNAYVFIARSQPEVLVNMYQNTILSVLKGKFTNKLSSKDGEKLKKSVVTSYIHELVKDNDMALNFIANQAYELYSKEE